MARAPSSSKFVSVNLNKSYGQPPPSLLSPSAPPSARSRLPSSSSSSSSNSSSSHGGGMVLLSRPPAPSASSSPATLASSKLSKLAVPRPVNLPSLRKEHAGNDPAVALVGSSGSSGWSKQQISPLPIDDAAGHLNPASVVDSATGQGRSPALTAESIWGAPVSQGRGFPVLDQDVNGRPPPYQAPSGRPAVYTPPGARNARSPLPVHIPSPTVEKAVVLRGEDFPSLQASIPSPAVNPQQRQKDLQQKQREKQYELKEQQKKLHQLSQQQHSQDVASIQDHSSPQLQPAQLMRPQVNFRQPSNEEVSSLNHHETVVHSKDRFGRVGGSSYGPSPLIRLSHTSNWADDERETLQNISPRGITHSDWVESGRSRNGFRAADNRVEQSANGGFGRPISRNGPLSGLGREGEELQGNYPVRNGGLRFEGGYGKDGDFRNGLAKDIHRERLVLDPRDDIGKWDGGFRRSDSFKRAWGPSVKDSDFNRDTILRDSNRPSNFYRDGFVNRDNGHERDTNGRISRDVGNGRDTSYKGDVHGWDTNSRDGHPRDTGLRLENGFGRDAFFGKRGAVGSNVDSGRGWQGDRFGRSNGYKFNGPAAYCNSNHVSVRGRQEIHGLDNGKDKRSNVSYGQLHFDDPFLGGLMDPRPNSVLGLEPLVGAFAAEFKTSRKKKEDASNFRDLERESFEAELERVQKLQEQERQRMIEEQEKAIELARKEQEEQERLAREEEELRLRLEVEAREAAARAQREAEEAARKIEEARRAREDEKQRALLEEERRKEAARRKLLELEERMAKREAGKRREEVLQEDNRAYSVRPPKEEVLFRENSRKIEERDWEDQERSLTSFSKAEQDDDERAPFRAVQPLESPPSENGLVEGSGRHSGTSLRSADMKGGYAGSVERTKTTQVWKRETLDNGHALPLAPMKSSPRDGPFPHRQREQQQRGLSSRDSSQGTSRGSPSVYGQGRLHSDLSVRNDRASRVQGYRWTSDEDMTVSFRNSSVDGDSGYADNANERELDDWWGREDHHKLREAQRLTSPPLSSYLHSSEAPDYPSFGRLRQSLPKQPRVPPPPGRTTLNRQVVKLEDAHSITASLSDGSGVASKASEDLHDKAPADDGQLDEVGKVDAFQNDVQLSQPPEAAIHDKIVVQSSAESQVFDGLVQEVSSCQIQNHHESAFEEVVSEPSSSETEDSTVPAERLEEFETDLQSAKTEELRDDEEEWIVQAQEYDMGEEKEMDDCGQILDQGAQEKLEDYVPGISEVTISQEDGGEHASKDEGEELEGVSTEEQPHREGLKEDVREKIDLRLDDATEPIHEVGQVDEVAASPKAEQEPVVEPALQQPPFMSVSMSESVQVRQPEDCNSIQSLVQQFQQPFSFMAVPLPQSSIPQSSTSNTVMPHPSMLAPMHGLQNQQEMPFHVQLGLLPGAPLMPNAIQIGSIQMPLHLHHQMPQISHLPQPPMFQFGQICPSAPLSQPLSIVQPAMQIQHAMGQPLISQHHTLHTEASSEVDMSNGVAKSDQPFKAGDGDASLTVPDHNPSSDGYGLFEHASLESGMGSVCALEGKDKVPSLGQKGKEFDVPVPSSKDQKSTLAFSIVQTGHEAVPGKVSTPTNVTALEKMRRDQSFPARSSGMTPGGRKRNNGPFSFGVMGQTPGKYYGMKHKGFEAPHSAAERTWSELGAGGGMRNRVFRRNFRRAEYKVRDTLSSLDRESGGTSNQGKLRETSQPSGFEVSNVLGNRESGMNRDSQREAVTFVYNRALNREAGQNVGALESSHPFQGGAKGERLNSQKVPAKNGSMSDSRSKGILKKYRSDGAGDAPLQSGVVRVFEQPGIEPPNDEDDFIEVRSKRQVLREQREQREKENKAKSKDFKSKEQAARKQQRLSAKAGQHSEVPGIISGKNGLERFSGPSAETASKETRFAVQGLPGTTLSQSSATTSSPLPPIGTPANALSDGTFDKISKASKPGQAGVTHKESGKGAGFTQDNHYSGQDSMANTISAWGGQGSSHKVVSLTQIQLEEAMKPIRFEGPLAQKVPLSERVSMVMEPGIALEKSPAPLKTPVSVSGPISSLLAGEKIQFGAVTSPTFISSSGRSLSPSLLAGLDSVASRSDMSHNSSLQNDVRHSSAANSVATFAPRGKRAREGDDIHGEVVDPEAEAEAAASAVAVAAISSDDSVGNAHCSDARNIFLGGGAIVVTGSSFENINVIAGSSEVTTTRPVIMQTPIKAPVIEDSMTVALPADLSVETPSPLLQGSSSSGVASVPMLQSFPGGASPYPCLEMGTMLGGPIFAFGPCEDPSSLSHGSRPGALEPGLAAIGAGSVGGWQQRHSGTGDSFYGTAPSGFTGPFISPAGGIPSIQGPPHMLVYTNPFAPIGQFGQLGVSFMGTTYLPSGKQPDWKHTPMGTSSSGALGLNERDISAGLTGMMASQPSSGVSNSLQRIPPGGSSVMPVAAPLSLFDVNLSAPFQISNADLPVQSPWSKVTLPPLHSVPITGQAVGLNLQPQQSSALPSQLRHLPHLVDGRPSFHQLPVSKPIASNSFSSVDAAAQFPDELGLGDSTSSNNSLLSGGQQSSNRGHASNSAVPSAAGASGIRSQRGRRPSRNTRGGNNGSTGSNNGNPLLGTSSQPNGSQSGSSHLEFENLGQPGSLVHHPNSLVFADQRSSQQGLTRASLGTDWSGSDQKRGAPGRTSTVDRGSLAERGFTSSTKFKQVYVAKPAATPRKVGGAAADSGSGIFSGQEVA